MTRDQSALVARVAPSLFAEALGRFGEVRFRATGRSMLPAIAPGDTLRVASATAQDMQPGDVVLYDAGGCLLAHRLVRKSLVGNNWRLVARGDSHWWCDPPISSVQVLGRIVGVPACSNANRVRGMVMRVWRAYSCRSAMRGSVRAARRAGQKHA
jgi:signal peptidase